MANNLSAKFFQLLCTADTDGLFGKACDLVKTDGRQPSERAILDGLAVLTNKHPMRGLEGDPTVFGLGYFGKRDRFGARADGSINTMNNGEEYYTPKREVSRKAA